MLNSSLSGHLSSLVPSRTSMSAPWSQPSAPVSVPVVVALPLVVLLLAEMPALKRPRKKPRRNLHRNPKTKTWDSDSSIKQIVVLDFTALSQSRASRRLALLPNKVPRKPSAKFTRRQFMKTNEKRPQISLFLLLILVSWFTQQDSYRTVYLGLVII